MAAKTTKSTASTAPKPRRKPAAKAGATGEASSAAKPAAKAGTKTAAKSGVKSGGKSGGKKSYRSGPVPNATGKHLVIVESPAKARTINKYLGPDYVVLASVGHVRDLPKSNPKGVKAPVPGVDMENDFTPTYQLIEGKDKTISDLKRAARQASDIWVATDLDREGEAIGWHLAETLGVDISKANRVVFNAITRQEIQNAFNHPRPINMAMVNAQQARRILDRIVGYQVSPLLWKKVAGGLSAGRVQSVAVRLIAQREREIQAFIPDEYWKITGIFAADPAKASQLSAAWARWLQAARVAAAAAGNARVTGATLKEKNAWLGDNQCVMAELVEIDGKKADMATAADALQLSQLAGFKLSERKDQDDPKGKGPEAKLTELVGVLDNPPAYKITSIQTRRTSTRPNAPFITSTLQQAGANVLGLSAQMTMRIAQNLYEGVDVGTLGTVGLITYMRTDSTHLSGEAIQMARKYIQANFGDKYLPEKPNFYSSSNKAAQEAHEAIRPTDVNIRPQDVRNALSDQQFKVYNLIWQRYVSCQMTPAEWDSTTVLIGARAAERDLTFKATGRTLVFDGFCRVTGVPGSDEATLPRLAEGQAVGPLTVDPTQHFTSPPPRYTEASLVKKLEAEGIGRPSTYASIIQVIQDRKYVEQEQRRFYATDLGLVVTDKLVEAFPELMDVGYTREMETHLDEVEEDKLDWVKMLREFYDPFQKSLDQAMDVMSHAKAEMEPAPYVCKECGAPTVYRFGRNGRFLSCSRYPDCKYAAPVDRQGVPSIPEQTDVACPECSTPMLLRKGRFGPFLSCSRYPECKGIVKIDRKGFVELPKVPPLSIDVPCPKCQAPLNMRMSKRGPWLSCSTFPKCRGREAWTKIDEKVQNKLLKALLEHEKANPPRILRGVDGKPIADGHKPVIAGGESDSGPIEDVA